VLSVNELDTTEQKNAKNQTFDIPEHVKSRAYSRE
jgi:hypothetical protein